MGISTFEYKLLMIDENKSTPINHTIKTHIPVPDYLDYRRGYVVRYFIQRINDDNATIYEVNSKNFEKYLTDPFWNAVSLDWRILGSMEEIEKSNKASVKLASKKMYGILFYLPNYLQFSGF